MTDFVFNIAKGRVAEFYNRVQTNDGTNSALTLLILTTAGLETDVVLRKKETVAALLAGTTNEVTNTNYARIELTDADLVVLAPDHVNDRTDLDFNNPSWTTILAGDSWGGFVICYNPDTTSGTDANLIPLTYYDFTVTPDGSDIEVQLNVAGFYRAQ